ncbi:IucA/IucC family siderophore biosynthesis protein [Duganella sp. Root336D2]|uniref:IucA/IucC family protein n=1 Tax=Duganella sp. Root336D2 TaxID=1736518 RepID=UPI0006FCC27A|nr:IucA/IucC family protein [Duganella sp. Root336D2]KQV59747.1 AcsD protein [Duganella sp. Root336D2]
MSVRTLPASRVIADQAATHALLNCLLKEFALPMSLLVEDWREQPLGLPFQLYRRLQSAQVVPLMIRMPDGAQYIVLADRKDTLGSQACVSGVFGKRPGSRWQQLTPAMMAESMLESCSAITQQANPELMAQIVASRDLKRAVTAHFEGQEIAPLSDYIASEQCLWYGHPAQVAPKARLWPASLRQEEVSPEFRAAVRLHLLEVPLDGLWIAANGMSQQQALAAFADQADARPGHAIISMHPIQAELFRADQRVQRLLAMGTIRDLGRSGFLSHPTASVRTMYVPGHGYFIKGSLNVRITNCVRKNAWYELESALLIDRLLKRLASEHAATTGGLDTVPEPAALSWSPPGLPGEDNIWFREQTGAILRRNFCLEEGELNCLLAGTVFGRDLALRSNVLVFMEQQLGQAPSGEQLLRWFASYAALLLRPVMNMFFHHGVIFEPHLQNTVLVHRCGEPVKLLLRDYEGVKLTAEQGMQAVPEGMHPRVRQSLEYPRAQGWKRIAYCLFVNNLSEAVLALSYAQPALAPAMWQLVREELESIRAALQAPAPELDELLAGAAIPCKTNFRIRLAAAADKFAGYVPLQAPWEVQQ